jgi:hypothetical protein
VLTEKSPFAAPRTVMMVGEIYFQCARAIVRSDLWNPDKRVDPKTLPTPGQILAEMSADCVGGEGYDRAWPERARKRCGDSGDGRLAPRAGFEPATIRLTVGCSTAELPRNRRSKRSRAGSV